MKDFLIALGIFFISVLTPVALSGVSEAEHFYKWDSFWYESIVDRGYISSVPPLSQRKDDSNVVSFPAYPALATGLKLVSGLSTKWSLITISWMFCIVFWYLLVRLLRLYLSDSIELSLALIAVWSFPTSFFLNVAYTESLFLSALVLFLGSPQRGSLIAGLTLGLTRIVGMPMALAFFVGRFFSKANYSRWILFCGLSPIFGGLLFFAYIYSRFGEWDLYFQTARVGWNVKPNYLFFLKPQTWITSLDWVQIGGFERLSSNKLSWNMTTFFSWVLLGSGLYVILRSALERRIYSCQLAFLCAAYGLYFTSAAAFFGIGYQSMSRYMFPVFVCWLLWFVPVCKERRISLVLIFCLGLISIVGLLLKFELLNRFLNGQWVS